MNEKEERRDSARIPAENEDMDLISEDLEETKILSVSVVDESDLGIGVISEAPEPPQVGTIFDWQGLKKYSVQWVEKMAQKGKYKLGLAKIEK